MATLNWNCFQTGPKENLLHHIFTMGALWSIIQTDLGNYSEGLQLLFLHFLEIVHVTNLPTTHGMDPGIKNHHDIVFLNFLVIDFFLIFWLQCHSYHIWKCAQTM